MLYWQVWLVQPLPYHFFFSDTYENNMRTHVICDFPSKGMPLDDYFVISSFHTNSNPNLLALVWSFAEVKLTFE